MTTTERPQLLTLDGYDFDEGLMKEYEFTGRLLGQASTHKPRHERLVHDPGSYAAPRERCAACRWFEVRIYGAYEDERRPDRLTAYYVQTVGKSVVPGEVDRFRVRRTTRARSVIASLVQEQNGRTFVPWSSRQALDQAADHDDALAELVDDLLVT